MRDRMVKKMDELGVDVFVYTSWSNAPRLIGDDSSSSIDNSQSISPITGAPAMTVPIGYANYTGNGGNTASTIRLPVGLQMVARPFREDTLFKLGYAIEQLLQARIPPPAFPECGTSMLY